MEHLSDVHSDAIPSAKNIVYEKHKPAQANLIPAPANPQRRYPVSGDQHYLAGGTIDSESDMKHQQTFEQQQDLGHLNLKFPTVQAES